MSTPDVPHRIEIELEVPGTPDDVWQAIATAEGISAWMMPTDLDPRLGGDVAFHMGPGDASRGRVTAFEPHRRVAYEEDWALLTGHPDADVSPLVTEFLVEARSGSTCVVRVVTSAFGTGAEWENEFWEELEHGWAPMLDNLRLYLAEFSHQPVTTMWADAAFTTDPETAISELRRALGVEALGDAVAAHGLSGHLERSIDRHFLLRTDPPVPGFVSFYSFGNERASGVHLVGYLFTPEAPAYVERQQPSWQSWLAGVAAAVPARPT